MSVADNFHSVHHYT